MENKMHGQASDVRILLNTGEGKGKTTAALGTVLRTLGYGRNAAVLFFVKSDQKTGECAALSRFSTCTIEYHGKGFLPPHGKIPFEEHVKAAQFGLQRACWFLVDTKTACVMLDEVCVAVAHGLIKEEQLLDALGSATPGKIIILTGRNASKRIIERADTVSEIVCIKHGFTKGIPAQQGVEW